MKKFFYQNILSFVYLCIANFKKKILLLKLLSHKHLGIFLFRAKKDKFAQNQCFFDKKSMQKCLLVLFCLCLFANATELDLVVEDLVSLNLELQEQKNELNKELFAKEEERLRKQKRDLLEKIPSLIVKQDLNRDFMQGFEFQKKQNSQFIRIIEFNELFYASLLRLSELFVATASSKEMKESISASIMSLDEHFELLSETDAYLQAKMATYLEILNYLRDNAYLFESNYIFAEFKLQALIDLINAYFQTELVDMGKLIICVAILLIFWALRVFLPPFILFCLMRLFFKGSKTVMDKSEVREIFIDKNQRPFQLILFFYAFSICFAIFYYPAPVNELITKIFYVLYAALFAWLVMGILNSYGIMLVAKLAEKSGKKEVANLIIKVLYFVIIIIATLLVLAHLGFNVQAIIASLGIGGLAVALAAKDIIANFFASLIISFDDSFNQGDWIELAGVEGTVVETGLRKTTLRTFDNSLVFLPNSTVMSANVKNWSKRKVGRQVKMILGVAYDAKVEQLQSCIADLREYLAKSPLVAHKEDSALNATYSASYRQNLVSVNDLEGYKNSCYVNLSQFADSSINIEVYFYTKTINSAEFREAKQSIMLDFMRILEKNKLSFAFPSLSLYVENFKDFRA